MPKGKLKERWKAYKNTPQFARIKDIAKKSIVPLLSAGVNLATGGTAGPILSALTGVMKGAVSEGRKGIESGLKSFEQGVNNINQSEIGGLAQFTGGVGGATYPEAGALSPGGFFGLNTAMGSITSNYPSRGGRGENINMVNKILPVGILAIIGYLMFKK